MPTPLSIFIMHMLTPFEIQPWFSLTLSRSPIHMSCVSSTFWFCPRHHKWYTVDTVYFSEEYGFFFSFDVCNPAETILHTQSPPLAGRRGAGSPEALTWIHTTGSGCAVLSGDLSASIQVIMLFIFYSAYANPIDFRWFNQVCSPEINPT